jgi:hypothetical protein
VQNKILSSPLYSIILLFKNPFFMRTLQQLFALIALFFVAATSAAYAETAVTPAETRQGLIQKLSDKKDIKDMSYFEYLGQTKMVKKAAKLGQKIKNAAPKVDFKTEPDRWLWYAVAGWVIAFLIYSLYWFVGFAYGFWYLGSLISFLASLSFLYWIYKKFIDN